MHTSIVRSVCKPPTRSTFDHFPAKRRRVGTRAIAAVFLTTLMLSGCVGGQIPEVPPQADGTRDPILVEGRTIWADHCVRCHGAAGDGGRGPKLSNGAVAIKYPNVEVQISIVTQGLNGKMPGFRTVLTPEEIDAVAAFTREVL